MPHFFDDNLIDKAFRDFSREIEGLPADVLRGLRSPVIARNDDPDERPVDLDAPVLTTARAIAEFEGRIEELEALIIEADACYNIDCKPACIELASLALVAMCAHGAAALGEECELKGRISKLTEERDYYFEEYWVLREAEEPLNGRISQLEEDAALSDKAMRAAYLCLQIEATGGEIPLIELRRTMQALETALRLPAYWPE